MEFRILGPIELRTDGQRHELGSPMLRRILAILAMTPREPVTVDVLIDRVWGDRVPARARATLYSYATRLRKRLRAAVGDEVRVAYRDRGYALETDPDTIDWHHFRRLRDQARAMADNGHLAQALELHRAAARLWRGEPLGRLSGDWADRNRRVLENEREAATHDRMELELRLGHHADVIGELTRLIDDRPYDETLIGHLMLALYRSGRSADALSDYRRTHRRFADELGTVPGTELQRLHQRILDRDDELDAPQVTPVTMQPGENLNQLPRPVSDFTGREHEIHDVLTGLTDHESGSTLPVRILDGMPGVGKTTLAVHLAHRLRGAYPDGQYYVDLHAHRAERDPADPSATLARLLKQLGVDAKRIPAELEERATLWRTRLAGRKVLLVLDDAAGGEQIRPLLPGAPECLVLVTSRRRLGGLDGAYPLSLDGLSEADSVRLFGEIVGTARADDAEAVAEVVRLCGRLPLAIRLVAARLRDRPAWTVRDLADRLAHATDRLGELSAEDRGVRPAFELSYRDLGTQTRRAFRWLGLNPGDRFTQRAAAALLDLPRSRTERILQELVDHHLLTEPAHGLYAFHDLLRTYADERVHAEDGENVRRACIARLSAYYLATAELADHVLRPHRRTDRPVLEVTQTPTLRTSTEARECLETEVSGMLSIARCRYLTIPQLAHFLAHFLDISARWLEAIAIHEKSLHAWRATGDSGGQVDALLDLALIYLRTGRFGEAYESAQEAMKYSRILNSLASSATAEDRLGLACWYMCRYTEAMRHFNTARATFRNIGDEWGEAEVLAHSSFVLMHRGRYVACLTRLQSALSIYQRLHDPQGEMETLNNLGDIHLRTGNKKNALDSFQAAAARNTSESSSQGNAILLANLGNIYRRLGDPDTAITNYQQALPVFRSIGDRRCEAATLDGIGLALQGKAQFSAALTHHRAALKLTRETTEPVEECRALRHTGDAYVGMGRYGTALPELQQALRLARKTGDPYERALCLDSAGLALAGTGHRRDACAYWSQAWRVLHRLGVPEAETVQDRLHEHGATGS